MPKKTRLNPKDKEFVKKLVHENNGNILKTTQEVYEIDNVNYASTKGNRLVQNDTIKAEIVKEELSLKQALIDEGITPQHLASKVNTLLSASKKIYKKDKASGEFEEVGEKPDYQALNNGLKHATNIFGIQDIEKQKVNNTYNFVFNKETQADIQTLESKIKARLLSQDD